MAGYYELKKSTDGQFMFNLKAGNNETILTSERYTTKASAQNGIKAVQNNCTNDARYERRKSSRNEPYFVLKAVNNEILGRSEMYSSVTAMENGIASVKVNGTTTTIKDNA
ncbi:MAG: YegP family protein [Ignavibacteriae bacterium]|nr:YegP family protein [Ignavibacteriota bacterium]